MPQPTTTDEQRCGTATATGQLATHAPSGAVFEVPPGQCVLDAALDAGLELDHGCRVGACGACAARIVDGQASVDPPDPIEADALRRYAFGPGVRLLCRATLHGPITIDDHEP